MEGRDNWCQGYRCFSAQIILFQLSPQSFCLYINIFVKFKSISNCDHISGQWLTQTGTITCTFSKVLLVFKKHQFSDGFRKYFVGASCLEAKKAFRFGESFFLLSHHPPQCYVKRLSLEICLLLASSPSSAALLCSVVLPTTAPCSISEAS